MPWLRGGAWGVKRYEIHSDGCTVWVNGPILLGRFSKAGVDVHVNGRCAGDSCTPGPCTIEDWRAFKEKMRAVHKIEVPDRHMPGYLLKPTCRRP